MVNKNTKTIFKNATAIIGDEMEVVKNIDIQIIDGKITQISKDIDITDTKIIDGERLILCPSFINAHLHLDDSAITDIGVGQSLEELVFPGGVREKITSVSKDDLKSSIKASVHKIILGGTAVVCSFCESGVEGVKNVKESIDLDLKSILIGRFKSKFPYESKVEDLLKVADGFAPGFIKDISEEDFKNLSQRILNSGGFVAMHSLESKNLPVENFYKAVDYLNPKFLVHLVQAGQKEIDYLVNKNIGVVCCQRGNSITGVGVPPILSLLEKGIVVALGTDNVFLNSTNMFREMEFTSRLLRGVSKNASAIDSKTVLKMATINGAKVLGLDDNYGSISVGKKANIIAFSMESDSFFRSADVISAIVHRAGTDDIRDVYLKGKPYNSK